MAMYLFSQFLFILLTLAIFLAILYGLRYSLQIRSIPSDKIKKIELYSAFGLACWLTILGLVASTGYFQDFTVLPPRLLFAALPPVILSVVLLFSKRFSNLLRHIPPSWLVYIQSFRIVMELLLWFYFLNGMIPFQMTFEGLNYDIIVGLTALIAGNVFFKRSYRKFEVFIWNIFGLLLLSNIVLIAVLSTPSPFQVFKNEPANTFIAYFPFVWLIGFIVPFAFAMHLFSIRQLFLKK